MVGIEEMEKRENKAREKRRKEAEARRKLEMTNWEDLKTDQKIERMRDMVKSLQSLASSNNRTANELKSAFENHQHQNSELLVKYSRYNSGPFGCSERTGRAVNYF